MKRYLPFAVLILSFLQLTSFAQSTAHSFTFGGQTRNYRVYLPTGFSSAASLPLVINMHGLNSNSQQQELYTQFDVLADTARCVVVYPDAVNGQWNVVVGCTGSTQPCTGVDDVGFISALIDTMHKNYNIDLGRVYSTGMSDGGYMTFRLACELSCRIAAAASVTGLMQEAVPLYPACNPTRKMPILQIHGTADSTVKYTNTAPLASVASTISRWKTINGCPSSAVIASIPDINTSDGCTAEQQYYGVCTDSTIIVHYKITGGGHTWPDASVNIGVTNRDFNATSTIWNFFKRYYTAAGVNFTGLGTSYCNTASAVTLTGAPTGGTFSGSGISGNQFNPANASVGNNNITYTVSWRGCTYSKTQSVTVFSSTSASINGLNQNYCANASAVSLSGTPSGGTFSGTGVNGSQFNPQTAGVGGPYTITYQGASGGCSYSTTQNVTVHPLPTVSITGNPDSICSNAAAITISGGSPAGGTYSGIGVSGTSFNPATAGVGAQVITYTYTDNNNCSNSNTETIVVKSCTSTEIDKNEIEKLLSVYPNPANDKLVIECNLAKSETLSANVYDLSGKLIEVPFKRQGEKLIFNTSTLEIGTYSVLINVNGVSLTRKFVKAE